MCFGCVVYHVKSNARGNQDAFATSTPPYCLYHTVCTLGLGQAVEITAEV